MSDHYNVLPSSIISRFIVRMHNYISQNTYWRTGVVLISKNKENRALVKADIEEKKIFISVTGTEQTRRNFLEIIRADFDKIHATIPKIESQEKVSIPGHPKVVVDYQHLCVLEKKGMETFIPEGLEEEVNVKQLLNGIESEKQRRENKRRCEARMSDDKSDDRKEPNTTYIFNAPVGAVQPGSHPVANVTQNMISDEMREQLIHALEAVESAVNRLEVLPGYPKEDIIDLIREGQIEIKKDKPNVTKLKGLFSTVATSIRTIASAKPAYEALKLALTYFSKPIP